MQFIGWSPKLIMHNKKSSRNIEQRVTSLAHIHKA